MADWHLIELDNALTASGWTVIARHDGDGRRISATWEVQRSTRHLPLFLDFEGLDDIDCLPLDQAYACVVRGGPGLSLYFGKKVPAWTRNLRAFVDGLAFAEGEFTFRYDLPAHGSVVAYVSAGEQTARVDASYISDAFTDLARAVIGVCRGPEAARFSCSRMEEPGENRWVLTRLDQERVDVSIIYFTDWPSRLDDDEGEAVFKAECRVLRLVSQVEEQMQRLLLELGEDGFRDAWRRDFPTDELAELSALIQVQPK